MKLSFSLSSKPSSNIKKPSRTFSSDDPNTSIEGRGGKEYVTEFAANEPPRDGNPIKNLVIPPKPNEWRPTKRMKNLDLPSLQSSETADQTLQFEVDVGSSVEPTSDSMSFGLNIRPSSNSDTDIVAGTRNSNLNQPPVDHTLHRLKEDLKRLPDDNGFDEFIDVPVEGFGAALMKGYGWHEGRGIGRNVKEDVKVVEYAKKDGKGGIGFTGELPRFTSYNEKANSYRDANGVNNGDRDTEKENTDRRKEREGILVGKDVRIIGGRDIGLKGRVLEVKGDGKLVILRLSRSGEEVTMGIKDVAELGSAEEERGLKKLKELRLNENEIGSDERRDRSRDKVSLPGRSHRESDKEHASDRKKEAKDVKIRGHKKGNRSRTDDLSPKGNRKVSWLTSHIRVRIISKDLKGGQLYLKKGKVVDVVGPTICDISMDDSRELIQGVDQEVLETALPKRGGPVLVLYGRHKGVYGSLVERDSEKETGVIRDADTQELRDVRLEQIAEYTGDPSYLGY